MSSTQVVAHLPESGAIVVGDLVHHQAHAWLGGGIVNGQPQPNLTAWQQALDELLAFENTTVYGGRGTLASVSEAVAAQKAYLQTAENLVADYLYHLDDPQAALSGDNAGQHYKAIADDMAEAYPDYALAYLVEFGVYGLAQTLAQP